MLYNDFKYPTFSLNYTVFRSKIMVATKLKTCYKYLKQTFITNSKVSYTKLYIIYEFCVIKLHFDHFFLL